MATQSDLLDRLTERAQVSPKEPVYANLSDLLDDALMEHAPALVLDYTALPTTQGELVLLLAWERVCLSRASFWASQASTAGTSPNGFGSDRDTPFTKNTKLAAALRARYEALRDALRANDSNSDMNASGDIVMGELYRVDEKFDVRVPITSAPKMTPPVLHLRNVDQGAGTVTIGWDRLDVSIYRELVIFKASAPGIYQEWNGDGNSNVPFVAAAADEIYRTTDSIAKGIKVLSLSGNTYFVAVAIDSANNAVFSNEIKAVL